MKTDSIIFDLDGTLWTSLDACVMAWTKTLEKTSVENFTVTAEMVTGYMGKLLDIIIKEEYNFLPTSKTVCASVENTNALVFVFLSVTIHPLYCYELG